MRPRVIVFALVATAVAVGLVLPSAGAKPNQSSRQFVSYTCAAGETAGSGTVAWLDTNGKVIRTSTATPREQPSGPDRLQHRPRPTTTNVLHSSSNDHDGRCHHYFKHNNHHGRSHDNVAPRPQRSLPRQRSRHDHNVVTRTIHFTGSFTFPTDEVPHIIYAVNNSDAAIYRVPSCPESTTTLDLPRARSSSQTTSRSSTSLSRRVRSWFGSRTSSTGR